MRQQNSTPTLSPSADSAARALEEYLAAAEAGTAPPREAFLARYPELAEDLDACLEALRFIGEAAAGPQAPLGAAGEEAAADEGSVFGTLGDFRLVREVGRGGMGVVYEAEQISLGRRVALKILPFASTLDPKQLQRFKNEAQAAAHLVHQHIVPVFATGCERGVHYYAMQFIEGQTLAEVIADLRLQNADRRMQRGVADHDIGATNVTSSPSPLYSGERGRGEGAEPPHATPPHPQPLSPEYRGEGRGEGSRRAAAETATRARLSTLPSIHGRAFFHAVARLGIQAAQALDHSHELGIIHRDIKPANMLVDGRGNLWITDFGLAHCQSQAGLTMSGDLVGTLRYMSPEQAMAKCVVVDHRTDIYSVGATLYELLTLKPVFTGDDRQELLRQIAFEDAKRPRQQNKSIPLELETIVLKALEKNPDDRYTTAQDMADDLERFVKDEPIRARRPSLRRRLKQWCIRHRMLVGVAAAIVITALVLSATVIWSEERRRAAIAQAVTDELRDADFWQAKEQWTKARQALDRAAVRLQGEKLEALQAIVRRRLGQVDVVARLEQARLKAAPFRGGGKEDKYIDGKSEADRLYAAVFADQGLAVGPSDVEATAHQIESSSIAIQLVTALDYWAFVKDCLPGGNGDNLRAIARSADKDPWRSQLRDPKVAKNPQALINLAEDERVLSQPPVSLLLLSAFLGTGGADSRFPGANRAMIDKVAETSVQLLRRGQLRHPDDFWINYFLARCLHFSHKVGERHSEAIGFYRAALALHPQTSELYVDIALAQWLQKKLAEAEATMRQAIELKPDDGFAQWCLGGILQDQQKWPMAEAAYRKAILFRETAQTHFDLGVVLHYQKRPLEAEAELRKAIELHPKHAGAHFFLGMAFLGQQKRPDAARQFREAIALNPRDVDAYNNLGYLLREQHELAEAETVLRQAVKVNPRYVLPYCNLGLVLRDLKKTDEAIWAFREALKLEANRAAVHVELGLALMHQDNLPEAEAAFRKAIGLQPKDAAAHGNLGVALVRQARWPEAAVAYERAIYLQPNFALHHVNLGQALSCQNKLPEAALAYRRAVELQPDHIPARAGLAHVLMRQQKPLEAVRTFRALDLGKAGITTLYNAACAAALAGGGQGDAGKLDDAERARFRGQARDWLRNCLSANEALLAKVLDNARSQVHETMQHWQEDADLDGVRSEAALAKLPEAERQEWQTLWLQVEKLRKDATGK